MQSTPYFEEQLAAFGLDEMWDRAQAWEDYAYSASPRHTHASKHAQPTVCVEPTDLRKLIHRVHRQHGARPKDWAPNRPRRAGSNPKRRSSSTTVQHPRPWGARQPPARPTGTLEASVRPRRQRSTSQPRGVSPRYRSSLSPSAYSGSPLSEPSPTALPPPASYGRQSPSIPTTSPTPMPHTHTHTPSQPQAADSYRSGDPGTEELKTKIAALSAHSQQVSSDAYKSFYQQLQAQNSSPRARTPPPPTSPTPAPPIDGPPPPYTAAAAPDMCPPHSCTCTHSCPLHPSTAPHTHHHHPSSIPASKRAMDDSSPGTNSDNGRTSPASDLTIPMGVPMQSNALPTRSEIPPASVGVSPSPLFPADRTEQEAWTIGFLRRLSNLRAIMEETSKLHNRQAESVRA
eukprot:NODE_524_length_1396_cov_40.055162_g489_i0.p1 GENE.NODE_524_length_1396_cov_40.055162_g489_i0~~NODE_524_length_1396_cov_40.055162_g489_i0.p1  ORF type:complete len:401 (-),score=45.39 NODE_524_length_1396_cov_40.055162_g489_i0:6-1208(-)